MIDQEALRRALTGCIERLERAGLGDEACLADARDLLSRLGTEALDKSREQKLESALLSVLMNQRFRGFLTTHDPEVVQEAVAALGWMPALASWVDKPWTPRQELLRQLHDFANQSWVDDFSGLVREMVSDHPTVVQQYTNMCLAFIRAVAAMKYVDARDEQAKLLAQKLVEAADQALPAQYLPMTWDARKSKP